MLSSSDDVVRLHRRLTLLSSTAFAETPVSVTGAQDAALPDCITNLNVIWIPAAISYRCVMTEQADGSFTDENSHTLDRMWVLNGYLCTTAMASGCLPTLSAKACW